MARKQVLQDLLRRAAAPAPAAPYPPPYRDASAGAAPGTSTDASALPPDALQRGQPYRLSFDDAPDPPLPPAVQALRLELRDIARHYLQARRRSGQALLDAARWLSEARAAARHGEWDDFLAATATSPDTAERLLRIYALALQSPPFAQAILSGRLNQSVAERLARASTPAEVVETLLAADHPLSVTHVERAIRAARQDPTAPAVPLPARPAAPAHGSHPGEDGGWSIAPPSLLARLQEIGAWLTALAQRPEQIPPDDAINDALTAIAQAAQTIQQAIQATRTRQGTAPQEVQQRATPRQ